MIVPSNRLRYCTEPSLQTISRLSAESVSLILYVYTENNHTDLHVFQIAQHHHGGDCYSQDEVTVVYEVR
jgi:hypothetical protein